MASPRLFRVILPVADIESGVAFYRRVFSVPGERVSLGRHYFPCGTVVLALYSPAADGDEPASGWAFHPLQYLYFAVPALEDVRDRLRAAGGTVDEDIAVKPWGERLFYARDPLGNRLCFVDEGTVFVGQSAELKR